MKSFRLLPLLVFAALALLVLKGIGLVTQGGYVLTGVDLAQAQTETAPASAEAIPAESASQTDSNPATNPAQIASEERTGLVSAETDAAKRATESLFAETGPASVEAGQLDALPFAQNKAGEKVPMANEDGTSDTEKIVLERLSDRRAELDAFESQLRSREAVVAAAEKRLDERITELKALEAQITALVERKKADDDAQFKSLVSMYENMKPKAAAAIFNQLGNDTLLRISVAMNPRKMSPILAAMTPARAQDLTALMVTQEVEPTIDGAQDLSRLPQIVGQ